MSHKSELQLKGWTKFRFDNDIVHWTTEALPYCRMISEDKKNINIYILSKYILERISLLSSEEIFSFFIILSRFSEILIFFKTSSENKQIYSLK